MQFKQSKWYTCNNKWIGQRAGNAPLTSVVALIHDHMEHDTGITESNLYNVSKVVETYSVSMSRKTGHYW